MFISRFLLGAIFVAASLPGRPQPEKVAQALATAEANWSKRKPAAYEFTIDVRCYCSLAPTPPSFRVKAGVATTISELSAGHRKEYESFDTIEKLFAILNRSLSRRPEKMSVEFEPDLGYPVWADIDPRKDTYDDELKFTILNFKVLTGPIVAPTVVVLTLSNFVE
jgi:uncharacterized protein DUF6174